MAHRWNAPKVARWEVKRSQWRLDRKDQLPAFLSTLPKPAVYDVAEVHNRRNGIAELYRLTYKHPVAERPCLFHGTTYLGLRDILLHGLRESCVPGEDEFTQPGVYLSDTLECSLYHHATATRFVASEHHDDDVPYCRFVLVVQPSRGPRKTKRYGAGKQFIYCQDDVDVIAVHVYRGWDFADAGERVLQYDPERSTAFSARDRRASLPRPLDAAHEPDGSYWI